MAEIVEIHDMAHGGDGVGKFADGKTVFVPGALPGERVTVSGIVDKGRWARAGLDEIEVAAPARVEPPCPYTGTCGGCQWQHADYESQLRFKRMVVEGQLRHLGRLEDPPVRGAVPPGPPFGYRNRMNFQVEGGRTGQYQMSSHTLVPIDACLLLAPPLAELYQRLGELPDVTKVVIRHGSRTGELIVVVDGPVPPQAEEWGAAVVQRSGMELTPIIGEPAIHEIVAGVKFRITGAAFFQVNTRGADELVALVSEALQPTDEDVLLDAYAGGGLFTLTVGRYAGRILAVETGPHAVADLHHNLRAHQAENVEVVDGRVEDVLVDPVDDWDLAICDPPRTGLGAGGVAAMTGSRPRRIAYVSCDPASFARDTRLLHEHGYVLDWVTPVDLFPQTYHVETVARFNRAGAF